MEEKATLGNFRYADKGKFWSLGGMIGGLVLGLTLTTIYGWTLFSASFWIGFGLLVGVFSGGVSYLLFRFVHKLLFRQKQTA